MFGQPIDPKRDEYRRYLERVGLIESLTKAFVRILRVRPENPIEYLLQNLGEARLHVDSIADLQEELANAHQEIQRLRDILNSINPELLLQLPPANINCDTHPKIELNPPISDCSLLTVEDKLLKLSLESGDRVSNSVDMKVVNNEFQHNPADPLGRNELNVITSFKKDTNTEEESVRE